MSMPLDPMAQADMGARSRLGSMGMGDAGEPSRDTGKVPMQEARYRVAETPEMSCQSCVHADQQGGCEIVAGEIRPDGVSDFYEPLPAQQPAPAGPPAAAGPAPGGLPAPGGAPPTL